jgi:hypothetical protein
MADNATAISSLLGIDCSPSWEEALQRSWGRSAAGRAAPCAADRDAAAGIRAWATIIDADILEMYLNLGFRRAAALIR